MQIVDELTYRSYSFNRQRSPEIAPERWAKVFGPSAEGMEIRYRVEYLLEPEPDMERDRR